MGSHSNANGRWLDDHWPCWFVEEPARLPAGFPAKRGGGHLVSGAVSFGRNRWRKAAACLAALNSERIYLFPAEDVQAAILVGASSLERETSGFWHVFTLGIAAL